MEQSFEAVEVDEGGGRNSMEQSFNKPTDAVEVDASGDTRLMRAVKMPKTLEDVCRTIAERADEVNVKDNSGFTPLHRAVFRAVELRASGRAAHVVTTLLDHGAAVDETSSHGYTALQYALQYNDMGLQLLAKLLMERGADINIKNREGNTALHLAVRANRVANNEETIRHLLQRGSNVDLSNRDGQTALHVAATCCRKVEAVRLLLESGAEVNKRDNRGQTPLHLATTHDDSVNVSVLLEWGASLDVMDANGKTPIDLYYARSRECFDAIEDHLTKLITAQLPLEAKGIPKALLSKCREFSGAKQAEWVGEVKKIKNVSVGHYSLYDVLREFGDPLFVANPEVEATINSLRLEEEFPVYGSLVRARFCRSRHRLRLLEQAQHSLEVPLPTEAGRMVLSYLDNDDIRNVIKAGEEISSDHN